MAEPRLFGADAPLQPRVARSTHDDDPRSIQGAAQDYLVGYLGVQAREHIMNTCRRRLREYTRTPKRNCSEIVDIYAILCIYTAYTHLDGYKHLQPPFRLVLSSGS